MKNKQKLWRRKAADVKARAIAEGKHERGNRYGKAYRNVMASFGKVSVVPPLTAKLLARLPKTT